MEIQRKGTKTCAPKEQNKNCCSIQIESLQRKKLKQIKKARFPISNMRPLAAHPESSEKSILSISFLALSYSPID